MASFVVRHSHDRVFHKRRIVSSDREYDVCQIAEKRRKGHKNARCDTKHHASILDGRPEIPTQGGCQLCSSDVRGNPSMQLFVFKDNTINICNY